MMLHAEAMSALLSVSPYYCAAGIVLCSHLVAMLYQTEHDEDEECAR